MRPVHSVAEIRAAEARAIAAIGEGVLIRRASYAVARRAVALLGGCYGRRVVVLAGRGHNGADALWAGVALRERGARVDVILPGGDPADEHGRVPLARLRVAAGLPHDTELVIDGLVGIGGRGPFRYADLAAGVAASGTLVVAVDIPSGVDADTGWATGAIQAHATVTFGALKPGLVLWPGAGLAGVVEVSDIGIDAGASSAGVLDADDVAALLPTPQGESTKYTRGVVGVVAGSAAYAGAAVLACGGAVRGGAGMVRLRAEPAVADLVRARWPEVILGDGRVDAWVVGPGLGLDGLPVIREVLATEAPVLLDADAITLVAGETGLLRRAAPTLVTPHTGEFERLTGVARADAAADRLGAARRAAADLGVTVLLKGRTTVVAAPDGQARINPTGTPELATAGTGDVLSGAAGALLAAGLDPLDAGSVAAWLHGLAGRLAAGEPPARIAASDVLRAWRRAVRTVAGRV